MLVEALCVCMCSRGEAPTKYYYYHQITPKYAKNTVNERVTLCLNCRMDICI